eukprot:CAMPEP_0183295582 /NCGR_PEP_ID=MMETSP0160_2-20130417/3489_1 /TAXON_ID=2839 ORGANISM="Odontella Sinensis, Strain Grunow 1884" /NCGR_SAMPLE_ID=MMETSP0160_2 /ASSEMBLY_ACC=CAM_ASM_000250 /LENGTH=423 /DNA_ID=CAMNT_0025457089 /DNA_START=174 /DNA_END=1445 /DNA_ORIENTATION=-
MEFQIVRDLLEANKRDEIDADDTNHDENIQHISHTSPKRRHAYVFLMAGCDPANRDYHGYLYNILSSAHILKESGSKADVVALVRLATKSKHTSLPAEEEEWLRKCGIILKYLPKMKDEESDSFYTATMAKFDVLDLTDYSRVIFLDSDVMPICNLDYVFDLSDGPDAILKENLVIAWKTEPSNAGFFMLKPGPGELRELQQVIATREEKAKNLPWPPFDEVEGWGHVIKPPDRWQNFRKGGGTKWNFYCVFSDQGLLYHWTKYVKRSVSIIVDDEVQNWGPAEKDDAQIVRLESKMKDVLNEKSCSQRDQFNRGRMLLNAPYRDFVHFVSTTKPWLGAKASNVPGDVANISEAQNATQLWFYGLRRQIAEHKLSDRINIYDLRVGRPPLGLYPTWYQMYLQANKTKVNKTEASATANDMITG